MTRRISGEGIAAIKRFEGLRLIAYLDSVRVPTIGYGHTKGVRMGDVITEPQAEALLREDLAWAEAAVDRLVKVPLSDGQFAALVSFTFNVGAGAFQKSTLLKKLNAGDYVAVPRELMKYKYAGGKVLQGLANRRAAEAGLWAKGGYVASRGVTAAPQKPAMVTKTNVGVTTLGAGTVGSAVNEVATSLMPAGDSLQVIKYLTIALLVIGAGLTIWGLVQRQREDAA